MNRKEKKKRILLILLLALFMTAVGFYAVWQLNPDWYENLEDIMTRGEFATELAKELELDTADTIKDTPSFPDIDGHLAEKYIEALVVAGIIDPADYPDGFGPDDPITRAEIIKMLVRAKNQGEEADNTKGHTGYDDQSEIKEEDKGYVIIGKEDGIIGDTKDNKLHPNDPVTKGEADDLITKGELTPTEPGETSPAPSTETTNPGNPVETEVTPTPADESQSQPTPTKMPEDTDGDTDDDSDSGSSGSGSSGGSSGGGSYYYPDAQIRFDLPETAHTDTEITVMPVWKYMNSFTWTLTKTEVDGSEQPVELADAIDGSLGLEGGTIRFLEDGTYTLTATAKNARGKETVLSKTVTVSPVIDLSFDLPETTHTDKSVTLSFQTEKLYGHDIVWTANKDGEAVQTSDILEGVLGNEGGTFAFKSEGSYTLTAAVTDETGRMFTHSDQAKVYPVADISFVLPAASHTDTPVEVEPILTNADGLSVVWSLTKNGEAVPLSDELEGTLTDTGSSIRFKDKGVYRLTGTLTDETGRCFADSQTITIYPVGSVGFYLPEITHTDQSVLVEASFQNLGTAEIQWSLTRNDEAVTVSDYVEGTLTDTNSTVRFTQKGEYVLKAAFTDPAGRAYSYTAAVKVYPVPDISYQLPETAHTDTTISILPQTVDLDGLTVEWLLENGLGFQSWSTYIDGSLDNSGGTIRFKHAGTYELIARITDETGRVFLYEDGGTIEVLPVLNISFALPETTHTDRTLDLRTRGNNNILPVEWTLTRDGQPVELSDALSGSLNAYGGKIQFKEVGEYTLTASMTDALGREFSYSESTTVYPIPSILLNLPENWYAGEAGTVLVTGTDLDELTASWTIIKGNDGEQPYSFYASGTLKEEGGTITFPVKGEYELILTMTDPTGRIFIRSQSFFVYPIPTMNISLPATWHVGEAGTVGVTGTDLDNLTAAWSIRKESGAAKPYSDYVSGDLSLEGGTVSFPSKGQYELILTLTDGNGRTFTESKTFTVYPIPTISITTSKPWYVGEAGTISVTGTDLTDLTADWTIRKDSGNAQSYETYAAGNLTEDGGTILFPVKGGYELILTLTDATGRTFTKAESFTVYPVPAMSISIPTLTYSGNSMAVTAYGAELENTSVHWLLSVGGIAKTYTEYASGSLGISGGTLTMTTNTSISIQLTAQVTDINGRVFTFSSNAGTVKPIASFPFSMPSTVHIGTNFSVSLPTATGLEGRTLTWSLTQNGSAASYTGSLSNSGGTIAIKATRSYVLTASTTDSAGRTFTYSQSITVTNTAPNKPTGSAAVTRTAKDGKLLVNLSVSAADPDGDAVTLEYSGNTSDSYYAVGTHTVKVRAKDAWGLYSDWTSITFTVSNSAPTTPVITRTPSGNSVSPGTAVTITASSTDPDGDAITYVWEGRLAETSSSYPLGKNTIKVKAVDSTGAESSWAAIVFFVADSTSGGGMTLTGPDSVILESGISGATITGYTFTVPPVTGHSGSDYGRVRGYNILTGQWDQLDYGTTTNGITFSRTLTAGIYLQLEFYYYTNHSCMYVRPQGLYSIARV